MPVSQEPSMRKDKAQGVVEMKLWEVVRLAETTRNFPLYKRCVVDIVEQRRKFTPRSHGIVITTETHNLCISHCMVIELYGILECRRNAASATLIAQFPLTLCSVKHVFEPQEFTKRLSLRVRILWRLLI